MILPIENNKSFIYLFIYKNKMWNFGPLIEKKWKFSEKKNIVNLIEKSNIVIPIPIPIPI